MCTIDASLSLLFFIFLLVPRFSYNMFILQLFCRINDDSRLHTQGPVENSPTLQRQVRFVEASR